MNHETNTHHLLWTRRDWECQRNYNGRNLRRKPELMTEMDIPTHDELHLECETVPVLGRKALALINNDWCPARNTDEAIEQLLILINKNEYDRELGDRAIQAIESQIPYIKFGEVIRD